MKQDKSKKQFSKKFIYTLMCGAIGLLGIILLIVYMISMNMVAGGIGVFLIGGGAMGVWYFWKYKDDFVSNSIGFSKPSKEEANSLVLTKKGYCKFMNIYEPLGVPHRCRNDNHFYHIMLDWSDTETLQLKEFRLPDNQYYDPTVFAERVIELPAHRKIFTRREKMGQYIKSGILLIAIGIIALVMIASSGG